MAVLWEECTRDFQQPRPLQFDFLAADGLFICGGVPHRVLQSYSSSPLCAPNVSVRRLIGMSPRLLWFGQMYLQNPSVSMPSALAVQTNLHQMFNAPLQNHLCVVLFTGPILFHFTVLNLLSFLLVNLFYFFFNKLC